MFEEGALRKAQYGAENVFDFSLGNPNLEPPAKVGETLKKLASDTAPGMPITKRGQGGALAWSLWSLPVSMPPKVKVSASS